MTVALAKNISNTFYRIQRLEEGPEHTQEKIKVVIPKIGNDESEIIITPKGIGVKSTNYMPPSVEGNWIKKRTQQEELNTSSQMLQNDAKQLEDENQGWITAGKE